ncbi:hypothetical protein [Nitrobacter winogradskyi]|uniref:Uncharacterized protein n=2 Tax=Nitrobacter winogradskyi TaxID=913 RepID=A0ACC6AKH7_NITWI|nr:hypothetical protein [Nitrobacter winogradskyi]MCP2000365.1 hypothetical protein [Nitrobacter winogradskyi]GEC16560.1 hypothetical protein NWI01_24520 [Nitrobacter winogradskyi]
MDATLPLKLLRISAITAMLFSLAAPTLGQASEAGKARYTLMPMSGGFVRLDTLTGVVSHCEDKGSGWACYALPEEQAALDKEIGRLQAENEALKAQLAVREPTGKTGKALPGQGATGSDESGAAAPKADEPKSAEANRNSIEVPLPSDRDVGRLMSFVERAWRRLMEMASRIEHDPPGRI